MKKKGSKNGVQKGLLEKEDVQGSSEEKVDSTLKPSKEKQPKEKALPSKEPSIEPLGNHPLSKLRGTKRR